jgi:hypothetical protein
MSATFSTPRRGVFERSDKYRDLHRIALGTKPPGTFEDGIFVVAVLHHEKDVSNAAGSDFIWFKVKAVSYTSLRFGLGQVLIHISETLSSEATQSLPQPSRS